MTRHGWGVRVAIAAACALAMAACTGPDADAPTRAPFVTASAESSALLALASADYTDAVRGETMQLAAATEEFAAAFVEGRDDDARALYLEARIHFERIEPVIRGVGDAWVRLELREADLGPTELWTGWHHAEKILWPPPEGYVVDAAVRADLAERLLEDTAALAEAIQAADFAVAPADIGHGAKELLDAAIAGKIMGAEEVWSGADLEMLAANVDGARLAFDALAPAVEAADPALAETARTRFDQMDDALEGLRDPLGGYLSSDRLTQSDRRDLSRAADALAEPLARLTAAALVS